MSLPSISSRVLDESSPEAQAILAEFDLETMERKPLAELRKWLVDRGKKNENSSHSIGDVDTQKFKRGGGQ